MTAPQERITITVEFERDTYEALVAWAKREAITVAILVERLINMAIDT